MKIKSIYMLILDLIFIAVFNLIFYITKDAGDREIGAWIGYIFIHISYLFMIATPFITNDNSPAVLGLPLNTISVAYFIVEIIIGIVLILINSDKALIPIIFEVLITGAYGIIIFYLLVANENTKGAIARAEIESKYIMDASSRVQILENQISNPALKSSVNRVYFLLHSSPIKTNQFASQTEYAILNTVYELENAVYANDQNHINDACNRLTALINERNRIIMVNQ